MSVQRFDPFPIILILLICCFIVALFFITPLWILIDHHTLKMPPGCQLLYDGQYYCYQDANGTKHFETWGYEDKWRVTKMAWDDYTDEIKKANRTWKVVEE